MAVRDPAEPPIPDVGLGKQVSDQVSTWEPSAAAYRPSPHTLGRSSWANALTTSVLAASMRSPPACLTYPTTRFVWE